MACEYRSGVAFQRCFQVQKAVQAQYLYGLESLSEDLPQQKVEIVVQSKQLRFKPPLEELRLHFYKEVHLLVHPATFSFNYQLLRWSVE